MMRTALVLAAGLSLLASSGLFLSTTTRADTLIRVELTEYQMGAAFQMAVFAPDEAFGKAALTAAMQRVSVLNTILSDYESDSELSRLSKASPTPEPVQLSDELFTVLTAAQRISQQSNGSFDVTVGPLTRLWRRARRQEQMPTQRRLSEALEAVGYRGLQLDPELRTARLVRPAMRLDLGGIAKGYAADEALRVLRESGLPRALVNAGGDVVVGDPPPNTDGWTVGIAPLEPDSRTIQTVTVHNAAVATSGDTWQYVELEGKRYSHIVDPRTGLGMTRRGSVTVLAPTCMSADAYASALSVMEVEAGIALIESLPQIEALVAVEIEKEVRAFRTSGMKVDSQSAAP